ncbi:MAG: DUF4185 domain-containing protein [Segniliparus sp.]|uniref:DUF4185 domain-containing protein n=1 Tax=Segniliparus sp. TaxID=2804064 RepID=UPI003F33DCB4
MRRRQTWLLAGLRYASIAGGLGLPASVPLLWWLAEAPAQAEQEHCAASYDACHGEDGPPRPKPVQDIRIVSVEPVHPAQDQEPDEEAAPASDEEAAPDPEPEADGGPAPGSADPEDAMEDDPVRPLVADDLVGGVGSGARQVDSDWRMDGADLGVAVDLGANARGEQVIGYIFGDATSRNQPFSHGGPDMDAEITWANPMLYTHVDERGNEIVDGFANEDDVPAYPAWSTRWVGDSLQAAGIDPEPPPSPGRGGKGLPIDLIGRDAAAGYPDGAMLDVVRAIGGKARGSGPASIVPTSAIVVDDKLFVAFQVANNWDVSAQWTTLQAQIVQFDLDPDTRRVIPPIPELPAPALVLTNPHGQRPAWKPADWNRGAPFQQMEFAMVQPPDGSSPVVYIGGTQEGRANDGLHMARSAPGDLLDPDRWEYYTARGWRRPGPGKPLGALPATPPLPSALGRRHGRQDGIGESSLMQVGPYLVFVYTRNMQTPIGMRIAPLDHPTQFGPELAVVTGDGRDNSLRDPRGVYGGFLSAAQSDGDALVATISHWGGYGTYQVRIVLNESLGPVFDSE